jgi:hypothetical protein
MRWQPGTQQTGHMALSVRESGASESQAHGLQPSSGEQPCRLPLPTRGLLAALSTATCCATAAVPAGFGGNTGTQQTAPVKGQHANGAVSQARKVALQRLMELAMGEHEGKLVERVLELCGASHETVKKCALLPAAATFVEFSFSHHQRRAF